MILHAQILVILEIFEDENMLHDSLLWKDNVIILWTRDVFIGNDNDNTTNATKMEEDNDGIDHNSTCKNNILVNKHSEWIHKIDSLTFKCFCMVRIKEVSLVKIMIQLQHKHI